MTAPALSVYAQEKMRAATRGKPVLTARATGCPRTHRPRVLAVEMPVIKTGVGQRRHEKRTARWAEWRKRYEVDGWALSEIAAETGYSVEGVRCGLRKMGVQMRRPGGGMSMRQLLDEVKRQKREIDALRGRIIHYKRLLATEEAA